MHEQHTGNAGADAGDGFDTLAIHAGQEPDPVTGAVVPPIYQVSTYKQDGVGGMRGGHDYARTINPTRTALEECLTALEGGCRALAFSSGMAASDCLVRTVCRPGDQVLIPSTTPTAAPSGCSTRCSVAGTWTTTSVPMSDPAAVRAALAQHSAKLVWVETPTNPLLSIADIAALAGVAHDAGALLVIDNTFASPYLQQPLTLGADVVVHSTTKYLGGHSDVVGGAVVTADADLAERMAFLQNATGAIAASLRRLADPARGQDARRPDGPALRAAPSGSRTCWSATRRWPRSTTPA